jgi:hypothetical protein
MWDEAFQLWDKRNKEIFESKDENNSTLLFDLKQQVRELYKLEDKVLARDRNNIALPLNERLTQHPIQLHNYVKIQGPIIRQSAKEAEKLAAANTVADVLPPTQTNCSLAYFERSAHRSDPVPDWRRPTGKCKGGPRVSARPL